jgi:hypothetical protein
MFNNALFTKSAIQKYYKADPTKFVREVLEGLANGEIPPSAFQLRPLAEAIMEESWAPRGAR